MKYKIKAIVHKGLKYDKPIEFSTLFDYGIFCEREEELPIKYRKKVSKLKTFFTRLKVRASSFFCALRARFFERLAKLRERPEDKVLLPALCGALCAVLCVAVFSVGVVGYKLFIEDYFGRYTTVTVPDFSGEVYPEGEKFSRFYYCNVNVSYEYSSEIPKGQVISQTPKPNVTRRLYSNKSNCNVEIVVSLGEKTFSMPNFQGGSLRDALLALKNDGVAFEICEEYSAIVPKGKVISTSPAPEEVFAANKKVTLTVSLGEKVIYNTVPNLFGLSEARAEAILREAGFSLGKVSYENSELPYGTVIWQSLTAYSAAEAGEAISFSVSAGIKYSEKKIPNLHGLSIEQAREKLSEVGLVIGKIYAVVNAAPSGTVVAQSLLPDVPISSDVWSVDIYVSS